MISMLIRELNYYFKSFKEIIVISMLFLNITLVAPFTFSAQTGLPDGVAGAMVWVALLCAVQMGASQSWQRHAESGELELLPLLPWMLESTVMAKSLAFYLVLMLQLAIILPVAGLWLGLGSGQWGQVLFGLAAGGLGLTFLCQMAAGLMAGYRKTGALMGLIVLPFALPILIFGAGYVAQNELWSEHLVFLVSYAIFLWPLHCFAVAASLRHGH